MVRRRSIPAVPARLLVAATVLVMVSGVACQPAPPSGRPAAVRRVVLLGDSLTWGLFTATPSVRPALQPALARRGIHLTMIGAPGSTPSQPWPGTVPWDRQLADAMAEDPDVVVIQTMLFPGGAADVDLQARYREAVRVLVDIAQARGARVLRVTHPVAPDPVVARETFVAQAIQAEVTAGRAVGVVPLNAALARCRAPFMPDGFHLSASGERCHAAAVVAAIDALRRR